MDEGTAERIKEICHAGGELRLLTIEYGASPLRTVEPHAVLQDQSGQTILLAWQRGGASASGRSHGWKYFRVAEITGLEVTPGRFDGPRHGFDSESSFLDVCWCKLAAT